MNCTRCAKKIKRGETYYRTKKGPHHGICPPFETKAEFLRSLSKAELRGILKACERLNAEAY